MPALKLRQIVKSFDGFRALDGVDLAVQAGTVHAIIGENGAGKTTLMNILYGLYQPDEGMIEFQEKPVTIPSPRGASDLGIGMIHQHFMLVDTLTVVENIVLGLRGQGMSLNLREHEKRIAEMSARFGFNIDPRAEIWRLPMGMRQRVEILKVLYREADLIILDEPTSILTPLEIEGFLENVKSLRDAGKTILFITHKLDEVFAASDRISVMRRGKVLNTTDAKDTDARRIACAMVGHDRILTVERMPHRAGKPVLVGRGLHARDNRGLEALRGVSVSVREGEIHGIIGVDGNGQAELAEVLTGMRSATGGLVEIDGRDITADDPETRRRSSRLAFVPEDRHTTGLVLEYPLWKNAILRDFGTARFSRAGVVDRRRAVEATSEWISAYDVRTQSPYQKARFLSGGNQQKLIFAREIESEPRVLIVMQPCKGLDVGAIEAVHRTILEQRERGGAILYISTELDHVLAVCDRISVMCGGVVTGTLEAHEATAETIGVLMGGTMSKASAC
ncbi:ABC transporter ATP-binding protein [Methylobacterium planeticum]|uniref:ABC transporter ATP-binding protein n=1 Tax=Methylobacterium planeticum TaxID=2615211 RepID=A0A6N6MEL9_9HYPH|nr:ABC transporter ATP-binding protein [Methylobacterium planeticum]KAB1069210.1 ABC transporter ATP-binding protein [Methylobacterium planeticum]